MLTTYFSVSHQCTNQSAKDQISKNVQNLFPNIESIFEVLENSSEIEIDEDLLKKIVEKALKFDQNQDEFAKLLVSMKFKVSESVFIPFIDKLQTHQLLEILPAIFNSNCMVKEPKCIFEMTIEQFINAILKMADV